MESEKLPKIIPDKIETQKEPFDLRPLLERANKDPKRIARLHAVDIGRIEEEDMSTYEPSPEEIEHAKKMIEEKARTDK